MTFSLSSKNVFDYLIERNLCTPEEKALGQVELKPAKNFNLLLTLPEGRQLLVKQEPYHGGKTAGEFLREWRSSQFFRSFPALAPVRPWLPEILDFDVENSIMVIHYLSDHRDLVDFYAKENDFPTPIAASIGAILAAIHRSTFNQQEHQNYLAQDATEESVDIASALTQGVGRIGPEVFGQVPGDGLKFFALYQRYDSLGQAIAELSQTFQPCCLTHNDLKLNNILLPDSWEQTLLRDSTDSFNSFSESAQIDGFKVIQLRFIDWERSSWGDPAFDLGSIITSYLTMWLGSLAVSKSIGIEEALRLAMTPLESLQPSMAALLSTYLEQFPEILAYHPQFLRRTMQFAGLGLVQAIQSILQHQKTFGNSGICMLQVAKTLLCRPEESIATVFGMDISQIVPDAEYASV
jgi:Choline/ethanolamine kinase